MKVDPSANTRTWKLVPWAMAGFVAAAFTGAGGAVATAEANGPSARSAARVTVRAAHSHPHTASPRASKRLSCSPDGPNVPEEEPAGADGTAADIRARREFPHVYGGLELTDHGRHLVVFLTRLDLRIERRIRGSAPRWEFSFVRVRRTLLWLERLTLRIGFDEPAQKAAGIQLIKEGGDPRTGRVLIQVLNLTPRKAKWLRARYGARNVRLQHGTVRDIPVALSLAQPTPVA